MAINFKKMSIDWRLLDRPPPPPPRSTMSGDLMAYQHNCISLPFQIDTNSNFWVFKCSV